MMGRAFLAACLLALAPVASAGGLRGTRALQESTEVPTAEPTATGEPTATAEPTATVEPTAEASAAPDAANIDVTIANFALNLECLEAEFYSWAAYGEGLSEELRGGGPEAIGGKKATLTPMVQAYAEELARNEIAHVAFLRQTLGDAALPCPQVDIGPAFAAAANAATGVTLMPPYTPYYNDPWFLLGAFILEDVGVTAYNGAVSLIKDKAILGAAGAIMAVEAYHGGSIRTLLIQQADTMLTPYKITVADATTAVSALRAKVGGGKDSPLIVDGVSVIVPADEDALAYARTVEEVLAIVYLGDADVPGGFYPDGINM